MLAQAGHYLAQAGVITKLLDSNGNNVVNWIWFGFSIAGLILNSIFRSQKERNTWVPLLLASSVCTLLVALN